MQHKQEVLGIDRTCDTQTGKGWWSQLMCQDSALSLAPTSKVLTVVNLLSKSEARAHVLFDLKYFKKLLPT